MPKGGRSCLWSGPLRLSAAEWRLGGLSAASCRPMAAGLPLGKKQSGSVCINDKIFLYVYIVILFHMWYTASKKKSFSKD